MIAVAVREPQPVTVADKVAGLRLQLEGTKRRIEDLPPGQEHEHLAAVIRELESVGLQSAALYDAVITEPRWMNPQDIAFIERLEALNLSLESARIANGCRASFAIIQHQLNQAHVWANALVASLNEAET